MTNQHTVTATETLPTGEIRVSCQYAGPDGEERRGTTTFRPEAIACRIAEYGLDGPREALHVILHEMRLSSPDDPDDAATVQGWVTTTTPDAEPIHLYNARSGADARGAHLARVAACTTPITDPDGHLDRLAAAVPVDARLVRRHRETVDARRWGLVYGGLPTQGATHA